MSWFIELVTMLLFYLPYLSSLFITYRFIIKKLYWYTISNISKFPPSTPLRSKARRHKLLCFFLIKIITSLNWMLSYVRSITILVVLERYFWLEDIFLSKFNKCLLNIRMIVIKMCWFFGRKGSHLPFCCWI